MALMFPRPLPEDARQDPRRAAERVMYESFERLLAGAVGVFYRVAWLAKRRQGGAQETGHRFKGLERPVVILVEIDDYVARGSQEILYVGVSRARAHLIIIGSRATLAAFRP